MKKEADLTDVPLGPTLRLVILALLCFKFSVTPLKSVPTVYAKLKLVALKRANSRSLKRS